MPRCWKRWTCGGDLAGVSDSALRAEAGRLLTQIVADDQDMPAGVDPAALCQEVLDEAVGLGPLEPLLAAADVTEIMVNRHDEIYVERQGRLYRHPAAFSSEQSVRWAIDRVVTPLGRRIDEAAPMVDARLPDGSRMHAIIPPAAIRGASLTIRKFPGRSLTLDALTRGGSLSTAMAAFLAFGVRARRNLIVPGGTGSGKTTLLNVLSNDSRRRARDHHRGCRGAAPGTRAPGGAGGASAQRGRQGQDRHSRTGAQCAAHAAGPDRRRRMPRRRGVRHAHGDEYRSRRFADHVARELAARCAGPPGSHGADGRAGSASGRRASISPPAST